MILTFINSKVGNVEISIDGETKKDVKEHLHKILENNKMRLTGWKVKDEV